MNRYLASLLKVVIVLFGIVVAITVFIFPQHEGAAVNKTLEQIYFHDPFIAVAYIATIPFFVGLFQLIKLLGLAEKKKTFSKDAIVCWRTIKQCALIFIGFILAFIIYLQLHRTEDDIAGGMALGIFLFTGASLIGFIASRIEKKISLKKQ